MRRYFFEVSYDGGEFHGWQYQPNGISVQEVLEDCLTKLTGQKTGIVGSGRTDTGVHCAQQFFHADVPMDDPELFRGRMNSFLPKSIAIGSIRPVIPEAHARFSALSRTYEYRVTTRKDPFLSAYAWYQHKLPDLDVMNAAAASMMGSHDFQSLSKVKTDVNHFLCTVLEASWAEQETLWVFTIRANRFLRGMVRATVGTLWEVGLGKLSPAEFTHLLGLKDRREAGPNVPPHGLFLTRVEYPEEIWATNK